MSSSSLTISSPRRAVVRQCTLRSDSPCWYSRTLCRSNPAVRRRTTPAGHRHPAREERSSRRRGASASTRRRGPAPRGRARTGPRTRRERRRTGTGRAASPGGRGGCGALSATVQLDPSLAELADLLVDLRVQGPGRAAPRPSLIVTSSLSTYSRAPRWRRSDTG
jgi:hypothetical protein